MTPAWNIQIPMADNLEQSLVLCLIPARGGSKGVARKNLRPLAGKPLIAYSIEHALSSRFITRTIVSTDDREIAEVARDFGAEVPFLRPAEIAADTSTDLEVFEHALTWLSEAESYVPDICVHLRPTCPIRRVEEIDRIIEILRHKPEIDSVRSIVPSPETPFKMWFRGADGLLSNVMQTSIKDAHSLPRQVLPEVFLQNASIDAIRTRTITKSGSMTGRTIYGYLTETFFDIDTETDLLKAEEYMLRQPA
jgi:CMP-N-acetylneuraminic acid synthetase